MTPYIIELQHQRCLVIYINQKKARLRGGYKRK